MSPLHSLLLCLLMATFGSCIPRQQNAKHNFKIVPRPQVNEESEEPVAFVGDLPDDFVPGEDDEDRYVGYCTESIVYMWPGNSRKFWSYGYVHLQTPYPANCTLKYTFTTRANPADSFAKYGFRVTGTFTGPNIAYTNCSLTDYVTIDDTEGISETFCGTNADIEFVTGSNYIEFIFVSQANSPGALGFLVTIESYYLCGGLMSSTSHGPTGFIASPLYAANYPPNSVCSWYFSSLKKTTIQMVCSSFALEGVIMLANGTTYCNDYLSISFEARTPNTTTYYCSSDMSTQSRTIYSAGPTMLVSFRSDSQNQYAGFNCTYDFILYGI